MNNDKTAYNILVIFKEDIMQKKKRFTAEEKVMILREYLENNTPISELSERYGLGLNVIYSWKKNMFESAVDTFLNSH